MCIMTDGLTGLGRVGWRDGQNHGFVTAFRGAPFGLLEAKVEDDRYV